MAKSSPFHGGITGSNPVAVTITGVTEYVDVLRYNGELTHSLTVKESMCGSIHSVSISLSISATVIFVVQ